MRLWHLQALMVVLLGALVFGASWTQKAHLQSVSPQFVAVCNGKPTAEMLELCRDFGL